MKKLLLSACTFFVLSASTQTTIFEDDFETGGSNWTLNGGVGQNEWIVNNSYLAFAASFGLIGDTPNQPGAITNAPNSTYLHIHNLTIAGALGIDNSNFDTGSASDQSATMINNLNTVGQSDVTVSFYYLCAGLAGVSYGNLEYSINNGVDWITVGSEYSNTATWTQSSVSLPQWDNQATLKFRFRWRNGAGGNDPAFSVDQVLITSIAASTAPEITASVAGGTTVFCGGDDLEVNYEVTDVTLNAGNSFTLELSDASGSFASPTTIGTLNGTATSGVIIGSIPAGTTPGLGYRLRVNSSNDAQIGTDNGIDLIIASTPATPTITLNVDGDLESSYSGTNIWFQDGFLISGESGQTITPLSDGEFTVQATNDTCVSALSDPYTYSTVGIDANELNAFTIYPNPASEVLNLKGDEAIISSLEVVDLSGKVLSVQTQSFQSIDVSSLAAGSYFIRIHTADMMRTLKFIKE
jgi:hypothetical protein